MSTDIKQIAMQKAWQNASQLAKAGIYVPMSPKFIDWFSQGWDAAVLEAAPASSARAQAVDAWNSALDAGISRLTNTMNGIAAYECRVQLERLKKDALQSQQSPVQASADKDQL